MEPGPVLLVGTSASGKSTTAELLQERLSERPGEVFLHLELDDFVRALPGDPFDQTEADFRRMERGYHRAVAAASEAGNGVIADHFFPDLDLSLLAGREAWLVGFGVRSTNWSAA